MTHDLVYGLFEETFPLYAQKTTEWFPNGRNSIRVRLDDKSEYVFTYKDVKAQLETLDEFINTMRKGK